MRVARLIPDVLVPGAARRAGSVGIVLACVVAVTLTGCGGDERAPAITSAAPASGSTSEPTPANVYEQQRIAGVTTLLDEFGKALLAGDGKALDALLDPSVQPSLRERLHTAAAGFAGRGIIPRSRGGVLRPQAFRFEVAPTEEAETQIPDTVQATLDAQGSSDTWVAPVELHYALGGTELPGIDEPEIVVSAQLVLARYEDSWKIVGDATLVGAPAMPTLLWDLPGIAATDVATGGGTSVVASYPDTATTAGALRRLLPGAVIAVTDFWGTDWPRRAVVVTTATEAEFDALAPGGAGAGAAAATIFDRVDSRNKVAIGGRVILTPDARSLPEPALGVVLRHELTHLAARVSTAVGAPMWITEGVPEYVGRKGTYTRLADAAPDLAAVVRESGAPASPPSDADFAAGDAQSQLAYQTAWSLAAYVAGRYGETRLKNLYLGVAGTVDPGRQKAAVSSVLGISRDRLIADWRRWLTEQVD